MDFNCELRVLEQGFSCNVDGDEFGREDMPAELLEISKIIWKKYKKQKGTKAACNECEIVAAREVSLRKTLGSPQCADAVRRAAEAELANLQRRREEHVRFATEEYAAYMEFQRRARNGGAATSTHTSTPNNAFGSGMSLARLRLLCDDVVPLTAPLLMLSVDAQQLVLLPTFGSTPQPSEEHFRCKFSVCPMGVCDEGDTNGTTYLYDESCGKTSSNTILSVIMEHMRSHESRCSKYRALMLTMDNAAPNKSNTFAQVAYALVMESVFDCVVLHYLVAGHTKFSPDRMFGFNASALKGAAMFEPEDILSRLRDPILTTPSYDCRLLFLRHFRDYAKLMQGSPEIEGISEAHWIRVCIDGGVPVVGTKKSLDAPWCRAVCPGFSVVKSAQAKQKRDKWPTFIPPPLFAALPLQRHHLSERKIRDFQLLEKYVPTGWLSYAHPPAPPGNSSPIPRQIGRASCRERV